MRTKISKVSTFNRREMLRLIAVAAAQTSIGVSAAKSQFLHKSSFKKPNIVVLVGDDHRYDAIRCMGNTALNTPAFDDLANSGTLFTRAHIMGGNNAAVCVPTRASLLTGVNVYRALNAGEGITLSTERKTLGQVFRDSGYHTYCVGKWHNDKASFNRSFVDASGVFFGGMHEHINVPVHNYDPSGVYNISTEYKADKFSTDFFADKAVNFIENYNEDKPFLLYTAFTSPHDPRTPPKEFAKLYNSKDIKLPPNYLPKHSFDNGELHIRDEMLAPFPRTADRIRSEIALYYGMISHLDSAIGRIINAINRARITDNTIIVYVADHGLAVGQHGLLGKQNCYEHSIRVPLIIKGPGVGIRERYEQLVHSFDLYATLTDLAGVSTQSDLDSKSLVPLMRKQIKLHRSYVHSLYKSYQRQVQDGEWKLIEYSVNGLRHTQLFNLLEDPWEQKSMHKDKNNFEIISRLRQNLSSWQNSIGDKSFIIS
jgi:arylsulfatase A-like enzyme